MNRQVSADVRVFSVVAIGGMGKSALTWKWFEDIAPNELPNLAGRMWWSFYESDAGWENFLISALGYTAQISEREVLRLSPRERESQLWTLLDEHPFLIVLDGFERLLLAYARIDAAHLLDDDLDRKTANQLAEEAGLPPDVKETYLERHRLRQCTDYRVGAFLRKLARVNASRIVISTRLYPAELQTHTAEPLPGCHTQFLRGLNDDDALALWRGFIRNARSGTSEQLLPIFQAFGNYPLLLRALAGELAQYLPAPGNFDRWREDHPNFDPAAQLDLKNAKTHVLEFALRGLGEAQRAVLHTLAGFRMPTTWDILSELLVGKGKPCSDNRGLDTTLTELEDRGLVGWDPSANRYDLHPIVRSVVWAALDKRQRQGVCKTLVNHFDAIPTPSSIDNIDDLAPVLELYNSLCNLERFEDAFNLFAEDLDVMTARFGAARLRVDLLERLFPKGLRKLPNLDKWETEYYSISALAVAYSDIGEPKRAVELFEKLVKKDKQSVFALQHLADASRIMGRMRSACFAGLQSLLIWRAERRPWEEDESLASLGMTFATMGRVEEWRQVVERAYTIARRNASEADAQICNTYSEGFLLAGNFSDARKWATEAQELSRRAGNERAAVRALRLSGTSALHVGKESLGEAQISEALRRARAINLVGEELPALVVLAALRCDEKQYRPARDLLDQTWVAATRGPYPLVLADARNVLARIERDLGNHDAAVEAAGAAYRFAWCDGPPYAYHYGLIAARMHLQNLGAREPQMQPFEEANFAPLPTVKLNPPDEFYVERD